MLRCAIFSLAILSVNINQLAAEASADPEPGSRYLPWSSSAVIGQYEQPNFAAPVHSRIHRPYFYDSAPEADEEYYNAQAKFEMA